jgi:sodium-dependent dicarboxylate transporter 2/3/5
MTREMPRSSREERFEGARRRVGLTVGPLLFFLFLAPMPGLGREAHALLAVFAWTVAYWVTEALPVAVTALLSSVLAIVLGIGPAPKVLAAYADPVVFLFLGSFILAEAMKSSGLDRRLAFGLLRHEWATQSASRIMLAMGVVTCGLSLWMSNTATTAIMLPVGVGLLRALGEPTDERRGEPDSAGARCGARRELRLHAAGLDAAKRDRVRLRPGSAP